MNNRLRLEQMGQVALEEITNAGPEGISLPRLRDVMADRQLLSPTATFDWTALAVHYVRKGMNRDDMIVTVPSCEDRPARYRFIRTSQAPTEGEHDE